MHVFKQLPRASLLLAALAWIAPALHAQESLLSETVGHLPASIRAGTGNAKAYTVLALPLAIPSGASWRSQGRLTAITTNTFVDATKDWTPGQWSAPAAPWFIRITGGAADGRSFLLSTTAPNTADTLVLAPSETTDLTTLGIAAGQSGDTYELFAAETLASVFPAGSGAHGGTGVADSDSIQIIRDGVVSTFYFHAGSGLWRDASTDADASDTVIHPDSALLYGRLAATPLDLSLLGVVAGPDRRADVKNSGQTLLANAWPVPLTLADSGIQNLPGWVSAAAPGSADKVQLHLNGVWQNFFHDGTRWRQIARGNPIRDTQLIPAGSAVLINRLGSAPGSTTLHQTAP